MSQNETILAQPQAWMFSERAWSFSERALVVQFSPCCVYPRARDQHAFIALDRDQVPFW